MTRVGENARLCWPGSLSLSLLMPRLSLRLSQSAAGLWHDEFHTVDSQSDCLKGEQSVMVGLHSCTVHSLGC
jgi:hypothetical protein